MPMQMGFRWYGEGNDSIKLSDIKQIPGVTSIVWALHHKQPGEVWEKEDDRPGPEAAGTPTASTWTWWNPSTSTMTSRWACHPGPVH